jgi:arylsulfatase A
MGIRVRVVLSLLTVLPMVGWAREAAAQGEATPRRPNVLLIVVDDLGYDDLGCYGSKEIHTPSIDRLASQGVRLTDFYVSAPICSPTRASLLTGRYPQRAGFEWAVGYGERGFGLEGTEQTLARMLGQSRYATGLFGKWHLGYDKEYNPLAHGFQEFFGFLAPDLDYYSHLEVSGEPGLYEGTKPVKRAGYLTDLITERSLAFLDKNAKRPFFLEVSYNAPHWPFQPPGKPDDVRTEKTYGPYTGTRANYVLMVEHLDRCVGQILHSIDAHGLAGQTLVIFVNDNGGERLSDNSPFFHGKYTLWEGGIRVPCLIRWPGRVPAGAVSNQPAIVMDLTASILAACAVVPPRGTRLDGENILPILSGEQAPRERQFCWRVRQPGEVYGQRAIRRGRWKYLWDRGTDFLFDLSTDPGERRNLAFRDPALVIELKKALASWERQMPRLELR